ncbi:hypothetical protein H0H93_004994 [Arthromyces matolae]|nr:hypothetical protein H0H93_004994 [Arthromyces matolae]
MSEPSKKRIKTYGKESEIDDEIDTNEWPEADRALSLVLEAQRSAGSDDAWDSLLSRARQRAQKDSSFRASHLTSQHDGILAQTAYDLVSTSSVNTNDVVGGSLWKVSVKVGCEESATFALFNKYLMGGQAYPEIRSIIGRRTRPGSIYIEASSQKDVLNLCRDVSDVYSTKITPIPMPDARLCLNHPPVDKPKPHSWARITKSSLYKGDLAYIYTYDESKGANVIVIPRVDISRRRSRTERRPPQALLKLEDIILQLGKGAVEIRGEEFKFRNKRYHSKGYHRFYTHNLQPYTPTMAEAAVFCECPLLSPKAVFELSQKLQILRLQNADPVVVTQGDLKGSVGVILYIDENLSVATVTFPDFPGGLSLPLRHLRKHLEVGDCVQIVEGVDKGTVGWVTSLLHDINEVILWDDHTSREVRVSPSCVSFYWEPQVFNTSQPTADTNSIRLPSRREQDPLLSLHGDQVTVVGTSNFKGYNGYIKNTNYDGTVVVETEAGLRDIVVDLEHVSHRGPSSLRPLNLTEVSQSKLPLNNSTPLPAGTSVTMANAWHHPASNAIATSSATPMHPISTPNAASNNSLSSPAWDPSSRTPNPTSQTRYLPSMDVVEPRYP